MWSLLVIFLYALLISFSLRIRVKEKKLTALRFGITIGSLFGFSCLLLYFGFNTPTIRGILIVSIAAILGFLTTAGLGMLGYRYLHKGSVL